MNKKIAGLLVIVICLVIAGFKVSSNIQSPVAKSKPLPSVPEVTTNEPIEIAGNKRINISEPKVAKNLSLFILSGDDLLKNKRYTTLSQAMETKKVVVKETGAVNQLTMDNNSEEYIFIHSGDIVKGGKQDRTISYDVIIPPRAKNVSLASFCVEQGRWRKREGENVDSFGSNTKMLSSRELKLAAKYDKNQSEVWSKVAEQKSKLSANISKINGYVVDVADSKSNSSLQLALESKELEKVKTELQNTLKDLIDTPNAIGYGYAINGKIAGVEVYNNQQLFKDLWKKLLESIIVEAISKQDETTETAANIEQLRSFIAIVKDSDKKTRKEINEATLFKTVENAEGNVVFSTEDSHEDQWLHNSYMKVDARKPVTKSNTYNSNSLNIQQIRSN